jgi:prevent-host-death family protein
MITTLRDSKARLSELVNKAAQGEEILISVRGVPKAKLVAIAPAKEPDNTLNWVARLRRNQRSHQGSVASTDSTPTVARLREERV